MNQNKDWETFLQAAQEVENDYLSELKKNKKLSTLLEAEKTNLQNVQREFKCRLNELKRETDKLKKIYPLYDLLLAKQKEVERMKKSLEQISMDHPERKVIEDLVKFHVIERDELKEVIEIAEKRFESLENEFSSS